MSIDTIKLPEGKILDFIDKKFRNETPEEYVRQNIERRLVQEHKYRIEDIRVEFSISVGSKKHRADIAIFKKGTDVHSQDNIYIIIECKKETVSPTSKKDGVEQLKSYMSSCINCEWGMWTNGKHKMVYRKCKDSQGNYVYEEYNDIPSADGDIEEIDRPKRQHLKDAVGDNLLFVFRTCHNHIYVTDGMQKQPAFFELLKIIFCKIEDERNLGKPLEFYAASKERSSPDGQLTVYNRISRIFEKVKKKHPRIFEPNAEIKLKPRSLAYVVSELQKYSLLNTHIDIKGKAYEELVGANLRGDRGEFFTPRNVMHMIVEMLAPKDDELILDPACGTGGFLVVSMNNVISDLKEKLREDFGVDERQWGDHEKRIFQDKIREIASNNYFGFDINPDLVKASKMNMVMNNDGSGNIFQNDSLLPPQQWESHFRKNLAGALRINEKEIRNKNSIGLFDVIMTNPPFGSKIPIKDPHILEQYELGHIWAQDKSDRARWYMTKRLQSSVPPEQLFIERCIQLLKPGGRMGIVLPDSILGSPGLGYIREWLIKNTKIVASIDLHVDTFQPRNGTQTSVLFLQKKSQEEIDQESLLGQIPNYNIFMAMVEKVGHDKRGNTIYKRDDEGNELVVTEKEHIPLENKDGTYTTIVTETPKKVIDDQTHLVPPIFENWRREEGITW